MISNKKGPVRQSRPAQVYGCNRDLAQRLNTHKSRDSKGIIKADTLLDPARKCGTKPETARLSRGESVEQCSAPVRPAPRQVVA